MKTNKQMIAFMLLLSVTTIIGVVLGSSIVSADDSVVDQINITVPVSCTMSGTGMNTHNAEIQNGTTNSAIGETTLKAFCNDNEGFAIYAVGFTDDEYGNNVLTASAGTNYNIVTGTAISGDNSNWAMKVSTVSDPTPTYPITIENSFDSFQNVPSTFTLVAKRTSGTDIGANAEGSTLKTTYQAYISKTQPAGTYSGQVKYALVHPALHAAPDEFFGETLQSVVDWGSKVALGQTVTVTDSRDNQEYTVARLADGKLWMTKNLRLDLSKANITADNTNNPTSAFLAAASTATSSDIWCTDSNSTCTDQIKYNTSNIGNTTTDSDGHTYDEYGAYYNWYTATAGNGTYDTASNTAVSGDICPAGWHLPTGTVTSGVPNTWTGEFWELAAAQDGGIASDNSNYSTITGATGSARLRSSPNDFLYSGYFASSFTYYRNEQGYYWSSTKQSGTYDYILQLTSNGINPGYNTLPIFLGTPIRCVTDLSPHLSALTVNYDEHITSIIIDGETVADGSTIYLSDGVHSAVALFDDGHTLNSWTSSNDSINGVSTNTLFTIYDTTTLSATAKLGNILQEVDDWGDSVQSGQTVTAYDNRDNQEYTVARLADGKLWTTKNMRLNIEVAYITAENSNSPTASFISEANTRPATSNATWCSSYSAECNNQIQYSTINLGDTTIDGQGHTFDEYGVYYNWYTATAGNGTYSTPVNAPVTGDICPSGWRLPTKSDPSSDMNGDFYDLAISTKNDGESYNSATNVGRFLNSPINLVLSGSVHVTNGNLALGGRGSRGAYWESVKYTTSGYARYLTIGSSDMHDHNYGDGSINYGNTIRCLAK